MTLTNLTIVSLETELLAIVWLPNANCDMNCYSLCKMHQNIIKHWKTCVSTHLNQWEILMAPTPPDTGAAIMAISATIAGIPAEFNTPGFDCRVVNLCRCVTRLIIILIMEGFLLIVCVTGAIVLERCYL